jgi:hypothetical protein
MQGVREVGVVQPELGFVSVLRAALTSPPCPRCAQMSTQNNDIANSGVTFAGGSSVGPVLPTDQAGGSSGAPGPPAHACGSTSFQARRAAGEPASNACGGGGGGTSASAPTDGTTHVGGGGLDSQWAGSGQGPRRSSAEAGEAMTTAMRRGGSSQGLSSLSPAGGALASSEGTSALTAVGPASVQVRGASSRSLVGAGARCGVRRGSERDGREAHERVAACLLAAACTCPCGWRAFASGAGSGPCLCARPPRSAKAVPGPCLATRVGI